MVPLLIAARPLASLLSLGLLATIWVPAATVPVALPPVAATASTLAAPVLVVRGAAAPVLM